MTTLLRLASVLLGIPVVSVGCWWLITLPFPIDSWGEFLLTLVVFFVWQAFILYSIVFMLLGALAQKYRVEAFLCSALGTIAGTVCGASVAGHLGLAFGLVTGPVFGLIFGLAAVNRQRQRGQ
jgi:hypothetical protein